jgi:hypothetical protein
LGGKRDDADHPLPDWLREMANEVNEGAAFAWLSGGKREHKQLQGTPNNEL